MFFGLCWAHDFLLVFGLLPYYFLFNSALIKRNKWVIKMIDKIFHPKLIIVESNLHTNLVMLKKYDGSLLEVKMFSIFRSSELSTQQSDSFLS